MLWIWHYKRLAKPLLYSCQDWLSNNQCLTNMICSSAANRKCVCLWFICIHKNISSLILIEQKSNILQTTEWAVLRPIIEVRGRLHCIKSGLILTYLSLQEKNYEISIHDLNLASGLLWKRNAELQLAHFWTLRPLDCHATANFDCIFLQ